MSGISAQYVDGLEFRIKELGEQVEKLKAELKSIDGALNDPRANLTLTTSEIIRELKGQVEKLTKERDDLRSRRCEVCGYLDSERQANALLTKKLAALTKRNERLTRALNYCVRQIVEFEDVPGVAEALRLPDLATPALNRIKAEAYREAADICSEKHSLSGAEEAIRARAAELEKTND